MHNLHFILFCIFSLSSVFNMSLWLGRLCKHFPRLRHQINYSILFYSSVRAQSYRFTRTRFRLVSFTLWLFLSFSIIKHEYFKLRFKSHLQLLLHFAVLSDCVLGNEQFKDLKFYLTRLVFSSTYSSLCFK